MVREFINACWFAFKWGLLAALMAAVGVGFYFYTQLNDQIRLRVQDKFASHYQNLRVTVRGAHLIDGEGIEVRGLLISDPNVTGPQAELAYFDEILLCCETDLQELLQGAPNISRIIVRRPRFHATRAVDGSWSFKQLLPLPKFGNRPLNLTIENGQAIVFDMQRPTPTTFTLRDINLEITPPARDAHQNPAGPVKVAPASMIKGSLAADHVQRVEFEGRLDRASGWFDIAGNVAGVDISPELMGALPADWTQRIKPLSPLRGQAAVEFHVWHDATQQQPVQFDLAGTLTSGRFEEARLPQALADLKASFRADNHGITLDKFTARNGPSSIDLSGRIDGYDRGAPIVIEGEAKHLLIGPQWEALLPPKMLEQWKKFLPAGEIHIEKGRVAFDGQRWQTQGVVQCVNVSFSYHKFPYRLNYGRGIVELTRDNRLLLDLTAYAASRPVKITGQFLNPGPNFTGEVVLSGEQLPFDASLYRALEAAQPKSCQVVQSLDPKGTFNFWVRTWREDPRQAKMDQHARIWLNRCSICYEKFPYGVHNITGNAAGDAPLEMVNGQWYFRGLKGSNHSGLITCEGQLRPAGGGTELVLRFTGQEIMLEDELRNALTPRMKRLWDNLDPQGSVNIEANMVYNTVDRKLDLTTRIIPVVDAEAPASLVMSTAGALGEGRLAPFAENAATTVVTDLHAETTRPRSGSVRTVSIHPTFFPYRLEKLQGEVVYRDGRVDLNNLRAVHDHTPVSARGYCDCTPEGAWHLHFDRLTIDGVRLDRDRNLNAALPPMLRKAVFQLNPTGLVSMRGQLDLWGQPRAGSEASNADSEACLDQCDVRSAWNLAFDMQQGAVHAGVDLKNISGEVVLNGDYDPQRQPGQRLRCSGQLGLDTVTWNDFQFTHVQGPMWIDDRQVILGAAAVPRQNGLPARHLTAKCYGGTVRADCWVGLEETPRFSLQTVVADGDLHRFCTEAIPGRQQLRGKVLASVDLTGNASGLHSLAGQGQVQLREADVYKLPLMMALLKILNFREPNTNAFSTSDIKFHINGEHITLDTIEFSGDAISLRGNGTMKLNSEINLTLHSLVGRSDLQLDAWKTLVGGASEQLMQIHVTGTLANPQTSREAFPTISQALQSLQNGIQPQERPVFPQGMRLFPRSGESQRR